jgi:5-methylcytosine-specific restriction endonuclease McrA
MPTLTADGRRLNGRGSKWITKKRRLAIYLRDRFACQYCGQDLHDATPRQVTLDHLVLVARTSPPT